jgi:hypothetical protein
MTAETFGEKEALAIGEGVTSLLREWTSDIKKMISDAEAATEKESVTVSIGLKVSLEVTHGETYPVVEMKFATGKKVKDFLSVGAKTGT